MKMRFAALGVLIGLGATALGAEVSLAQYPYPGDQPAYCECVAGCWTRYPNDSGRRAQCMDHCADLWGQWTCPDDPGAPPLTRVSCAPATPWALRGRLG